MKRLLMLCSLLVGMVVVAHAGVALDMGAAPASYNTSIFGSTFTATGAAQTTISVSLTAPTVNGQTCKNCFTKYVVSESTNVVFYALDGTTTAYFLPGIGLGASGVNTHTYNNDHTGPVCYTAGNTTTLKAIATVPFNGTANPSSINYEGYTYCGPGNNANN